MKKEVLVAIIIGFGLGLVITFGIWTANKALKETGPKKEATPEQATEETIPTPTPTHIIVINSPEDNSISNKEKIEITGKTTPTATVAILYEGGEKIIEADSEGGFSVEISLIGGSNEITIVAYDPEGNEASKTLTVVYSTAEI